MPRTIEKTIYKFDELDGHAKEKAREWYRSFAFEDWQWDCIYEDAAVCGELIGIDLRQKIVQRMDGTRTYEPKIYWSGFSSQGDGACFEGVYRYKVGARHATIGHAPLEQELQRIAEALQSIQSKNFYQLTARMKHRGHYQHSGCMDVEVDRSDGNPMTDDAEDEVKRLMRDFADWIYQQLEREYEFQTSDECVDHNIRVNEYEFDEDGEPV